MGLVILQVLQRQDFSSEFFVNYDAGGFVEGKGTAEDTFISGDGVDSVATREIRSGE